jgi:aryl-alcohol dehydrogenase-like predicted oxidoreductase
MKTAEKIISLASNQVPYSMLNRKIERDVVPYCMEKKKAIIAYSPLERGLLTGKIQPGQSFGEGDHRATHKLFATENVKRINAFLEKLKPLADSKHATLGQLALRWTIEQPGITIALAGARDAQQAIQNAKAIEVQLTKDEIMFINGELAKLTLL